jgi:hypothetical protein
VRGQIVRFVARFALLYAALLLIATRVPIYVWIEHALVRAVEPTLASGGNAVRELSLDTSAGAPAYRYEVELAGIRRALDGPIHVHGFVPLMTLALVLATPQLSRAKRAGFAVAGTLASALLAAGMLMSDLQGYELAAFPSSSGPYPRVIALFDGLHRTAAAGLIPLVLWSFAAFSVLRERRGEP